MTVRFRRVLPSEYVVSEWSGGKTTQLAIAPEGAVYAERAFLWRLSSATVELESSDFTPLPDYTRLISVLRGTMRLRHDGGPEIVLGPYEVHSFDGGAATHSEGRCTDFNLMLRKGRCCGSVQALGSDGAGKILLAPAVESPRNYLSRTAAVYCGQGEVKARIGDQSAELKQGETLLVEDIENRPLNLEWPSAVRLMLAQIQF